MSWLFSGWLVAGPDTVRVSAPARSHRSAAVERHLVMVSGNIVAEMFPHELINDPQRCLLGVGSFEPSSS